MTKRFVMPQHLENVKVGESYDKKISKETNNQQFGRIWISRGRGGNGHDGCMGRLILTLSAGVPHNAGHLVTTQKGRT